MTRLLADISNETEVEGLVICLLVVALVAAFTYAVCHVAGRPDWGRIGAALIAIVGALLCLLGAV